MKIDRRVWKGNPVSAGVARAKTYIYRPLELKVEMTTFEKGEEELQLKKLQKAIWQAGKELDDLYESMRVDEEDKAKIFLAHKEILEDEEILEEMEMAIREEHIEPAYAIQKVFTEFAKMLAKVDNPLIAGRATDLQDVKQRLLRAYLGKEDKNLMMLPEDVIIVAHDLFPSDTATMDKKHVKGIITEVGGYNSHSAILARNYEIPAVLGILNAMTEIPNGEDVILDALSGDVILFPSEEEILASEEKKKNFLAKKAEEAEYLCKPCKMKDGTEIKIGINVGSSEFEVNEDSFDFVGLFRTEFLYMESNALPTEEEQFEAYKKVLANAKGHPVTLRTLDIGGDKTLSYMELPKEENPFLGKRALRLCFAENAIFMTQLRAALRASTFGKLQIMFPMVGSMEDIYQAKAFLEKAKQELREEGKAFDEDIKVGIMIEVPSIALIADMAAEEVDFASIGSNDLTQYVCAADRMNSDTVSYYQNYSPAMLRLLRHIFSIFNEQGKEISVCGEMAGNAASAAVLAGLGAKKLSMSATSISGVKAVLAKVTLEEAKELAEKCCGAKTEAQIKALMEK